MRDYARMLWLVCFAMSAGALVVPAIAGTPVPGVADPNQVVQYSTDGGKSWKSVRSDASGTFHIPVDESPGPHPLILTTGKNGKTIDRSYFNNSFAVTSPSMYARFSSDSGRNVSVQLKSEADDTVDVYVVDPYDRSGMGSANAKPVADVLNGMVSDKTIRSIGPDEAHIAVKTGTNTLQWDGKDDKGAPAPPGRYEVVIRRANTDHLLELEERLPVVVDGPRKGPRISGVTASVKGASLRISWTTDVPTTGRVVWDTDGRALGRLDAQGAAARTHTVWLPRTEPKVTYDYFIVATDPATGASRISDRESVTTEDGVYIGNPWAAVSSPAEAKISWDTAGPEPTTAHATSRVEYAEVGPAIESLRWQTNDDAGSISGDLALVTLTGLKPDAEYAYRVVSSPDGNWDNATRSEYGWFATKTEPANLRITSPENGSVVERISDVVVTAGDMGHRRFSDRGVLSVELYIDGAAVESSTVTLRPDCAQYTFHAASLGLQKGLHKLEAVAHDDFWQTTRWRAQVYVEPEGGR